MSNLTQGNIKTYWRRIGGQRYRDFLAFGYEEIPVETIRGYDREKMLLSKIVWGENEERLFVINIRIENLNRYSTCLSLNSLESNLPSNGRKSRLDSGLNSLISFYSIVSFEGYNLIKGKEFRFRLEAVLLDNESPKDIEDFYLTIYRKIHEINVKKKIPNSFIERLHYAVITRFRLFLVRNLNLGYVFDRLDFWNITNYFIVFLLAVYLSISVVLLILGTLDWWKFIVQIETIDSIEVLLFWVFAFTGGFSLAYLIRYFLDDFF